MDINIIYIIVSTFITVFIISLLRGKEKNMYIKNIENLIKEQNTEYQNLLKNYNEEVKEFLILINNKNIESIPNEFQKNVNEYLRDLSQSLLKVKDNCELFLINLKTAEKNLNKDDIISPKLNKFHENHALVIKKFNISISKLKNKVKFYLPEYDEKTTDDFSKQFFLLISGRELLKVNKATGAGSEIIENNNKLLKEVLDWSIYQEIMEQENYTKLLGKELEIFNELTLTVM